MEMTRERYWVAIGAALVFLIIGYYLFLYRPLARELKKKAEESRLIENTVTSARVDTRSPGREGIERKLISEENVSTAIEELTSHGKMVGVNFLSISSRSREHVEGRPYSVLPIEMELESSFEALGRFLGSLEELRKCLVTVRTFETVPEGGSDAAKLKTKLTVNLYVAGA